MNVRTYEMPSMKDAVKAIKSELGHDAVILNVREKPFPEGGNGKVFEVTAAAATSRPTGATAYHDAPGPELAILQTRLQGIEARLSTLTEAAAHRDQIESLETGMHEVKLLLLEALRNKEGSTLRDLPPAIASVERQMRLMGVDDTHIASMVKHLRNLPAPGSSESQTLEAAEEHFKSQAIRWMLKKVKIAPRWSILPGSTSIHVFVGATGVGKTSTIAKIASHYALKEKTKVLLIAFETLRIAAAEQLRIYAKVIGAPFETISDPSELAAAIAKHPDAELVLIDSSGRSPKSAKHRKELDGLSQLALPIDCHVVLPTTEKEGQLDRTIRYFSPLGIQSLIFTKLDESWSYGEIFNLTSRWSLPLSFFSTGASIPEDLERATRERVIERIFGI